MCKFTSVGYCGIYTPALSTSLTRSFRRCPHHHRVTNFLTYVVSIMELTSREYLRGLYAIAVHVIPNTCFFLNCANHKFTALYLRALLSLCIIDSSAKSFSAYSLQKYDLLTR